MPPGRQLSRVAAVLVIGLTTATPAEATTGVFIDPGGPSGKEYALQLPAARNIGAGGGGTPGAQGQTSLVAPLFGVGITAPRRGRAPAGRRSGSRASRSGAGGAATASSSSRPLDQLVLDRVRELEQQGSGGALGDEVLLCAAVLAAGAVGGLALSRARRQPRDA